MKQLWHQMQTVIMFACIYTRRGSKTDSLQNPVPHLETLREKRQGYFSALNKGAHISLRNTSGDSPGIREHVPRRT